jgi:2-iminobutanoate/2-iminopropanoate deaminase
LSVTAFGAQLIAINRHQVQSFALKPGETMLKSSVVTATIAGTLLAASSAPRIMAAEQPGVIFHPRTDSLPFSSAVRVGDVLYLSGELGAADDEKSVVPGGMPAEARRMMERIGRTLKQHDLTYDDLFKCSVMLSDMRDWPAFNAIYASYFKPGHYPARSAMGVSGLALDAHVEMECWAHAPQKREP